MMFTDVFHQIIFQGHERAASACKKKNSSLAWLTWYVKKQSEWLWTCPDFSYFLPDLVLFILDCGVNTVLRRKENNWNSMEMYGISAWWDYSGPKVWSFAVTRGSHKGPKLRKTNMSIWFRQECFIFNYTSSNYYYSRNTCWECTWRVNMEVSILQIILKTFHGTQYSLKR